ncbi:DUF6571 family protein, partial [Sphaerisporangium melleum]
AEVERWIDDHLPDLRRRLQIARNTATLPNWSPAGAAALVPYQEKTVLPAAEAQRLGRQLAEQYTKIDGGILNLDRQQQYQQVLDTLAEHVHDPAYTAAFFTALGTDEALQLPIVLREQLGRPEEATLAPPRPDDEIIRTVSQAFATALSAATHSPGMTQISDALRRPELGAREAFGGSLLLSAGAFPAQWLAQVLAARGLATPRTVEAGYLYALGNNPSAARLAINAAVGHPADQAKLKKWLTEFTNHTSGPYATDGEADAFGRMLAAASGAYDETDGNHTKDAAHYAYTIMTTIDDLKIGDATRVHLAEIAGSYATEITEGANLGDANQLLPSAFGSIKSQLPGLAPKFRLSPEDTYKFIKTFTDKLDHQAPFQVGMDFLTARVTQKAVSEVSQRQPALQLEETFAALGNVRGLQLAARKTYARTIDDAAEEFDKVRSFAIGTGMGVAGLVPPFESIPVTWTALSTAWSAIDTFKSDEVKEIEKIETTEKQVTLVQRHAVAQSLMDAGVRAQVSPRDYHGADSSNVALADERGHLRPFTEILKSGRNGIVALDGWFIDNGLGSEHPSLANSAKKLADLFNGGKTSAEAQAEYFN